MVNIYYTAREGRRNLNGHTLTKGEVYIARNDSLENIGKYVHQSGGAGIEESILDVVKAAGIDIGRWRDAVSLTKI